MRKYFLVLITVLFLGLSPLGCVNQIQPVTTRITTIEPTATHQLVEATRGEGTFLPTVTLAPITPVTPLPSATTTPLPKDIFDSFSVDFYRNTVKTIFGSILAGDTIKEKIFVDNTLGNIHFTLAWEKGNLNMLLIQPDGTVIDLSTETGRNISITSKPTYMEYTINGPQTGTWTMMISSKASLAVNYRGDAYSTACPMRVIVIFDNENSFIKNIESNEKSYKSGDCIKLSAKIEDIILLDHNQHIYIHGADIQVTVKDPTRNQYSFKLYDDGLHGDIETGDGIYSNYFCNTENMGEYLFHVKISGVTNWNDGYRIGKLPFTRELIRSMVVQ